MFHIPNRKNPEFRKQKKIVKKLLSLFCPCRKKATKTESTRKYFEKGVLEQEKKVELKRAKLFSSRLFEIPSPSPSVVGSLSRIFVPSTGPKKRYLYKWWKRVPRPRSPGPSPPSPPPTKARGAVPRYIKTLIKM